MNPNQQTREHELSGKIDPSIPTETREPDIPELEFDRHRDKLTPYWQKKVGDFRIEIAEQDDELARSETRVEVLESALREIRDVTYSTSTAWGIANAALKGKG